MCRELAEGSLHEEDRLHDLQGELSASLKQKEDSWRKASIELCRGPSAILETVRGPVEQLKVQCGVGHRTHTEWEPQFLLSTTNQEKKN